MAVALTGISWWVSSFFDFPFLLSSLYGNRRRIKENLHLLIYMVGGFFVLFFFLEGETNTAWPAWPARARALSPTYFWDGESNYPDPFSVLVFVYQTTRAE